MKYKFRYAFKGVKMMIYQIIGILVGFFAIIWTILRFKKGKVSPGMMILWNFIWIVIITVSVYPDLTSFIAKFTGIGRGLDLALVLGLILGYYLIFKVYNKLEIIEEELTDLVREIAIQNENLKILDEKSDDKKP